MIIDVIILQIHKFTVSLPETSRQIIIIRLLKLCVFILCCQILLFTFGIERLFAARHGFWGEIFGLLKFKAFHDQDFRLSICSIINLCMDNLILCRVIVWFFFDIINFNLFSGRKQASFKEWAFARRCSRHTWLHEHRGGILLLFRSFMSECFCLLRYQRAHEIVMLFTGVYIYGQIAPICIKCVKVRPSERKVLHEIEMWLVRSRVLLLLWLFLAITACGDLIYIQIDIYFIQLCLWNLWRSFRLFP